MPRPRSFADETELARTRRARRITRELAVLYPDAHCELDFRNPLELLVATILSAQTTDVRVNMVTPVLFAKYRTAAEYAAADRAEMETIVPPPVSSGRRPTPSSAWPRPSATGTAARCRPASTTWSRCPGWVARPPTSSSATPSGSPASRSTPISGGSPAGFGWTAEEDPVKVEHEVGALIPRKEWTVLSHRMIWHGRRRCFARKPACGACPVAPLCPSFGEGETDPEKAAKLVKPDSAFSTVPAATG